MESLPSDIVLDIIFRVPAESVLECKLVCKKWESLIRGSKLIHMHLSHQLNHLHGDNDDNDKLAAKVESCLFFACRIDDPDDFTTLLFHGGRLSDGISIDGKYIYNHNLKGIYHAPMHTNPLSDHLVGSCNGLVCAYNLHNLVLDPIYICNPLTREYVFLPKLVVKKEDVDPDRIVEGEVNLYYDLACGFGYVHSTNEYKVVRIHYLDYDEGNVEVYTLGSGCGWRAIGTVAYRLDASRKGTGTYANDTIYWFAGIEVVAFDLADEEFRLLPVPRMQNRKPRDRFGLVALGSHLCLYMDKLHVEIWSLMKKSRGSKETWCMEFDIDYEAVIGSRERCFQPFLLTKNGEIIFLHADSVLYSYDTKTTFVKMISDKPPSNIETVEAIAHVNTFASLEAMGEISKRHMVRTLWDAAAAEFDRVALGEETDTTRFKLN